ncbi:hypothetical protein CBL_06404 [Carabus blaptoides fortunei]
MFANWQQRFENQLKCDEFDIWVDAPVSSTEDSSWTTATLSEPFSELEFDEPPRTSTPEPSSSAEDTDDSRNAYAAWKNHLHTSPNKDKVKVRGASLENEDIICGHLDMKKQEEDCYTYPLLNKCFLNLVINGPPPLIYPEQKRRDDLLRDQFCLHPCNCAANLANNVNLPIGYKYDDNGIIVTSSPSIQDHVYYRDPTCIYTI